MSRVNRFGRTDHIPEDIKRQIRQQCGFGCVNCGSPFYDYEHWNPPFKDLDTDPSPEGITLCCPSCHRIKGGLLSIEEYEQNIKSPFALREGRVTTNWSKGFSPEIVLGNVIFSGGTKILEIDGNLMIGFFPPEIEGSPPRLLARFFDRDGNECFRINNNECIGNPNNWDITSNGIKSGGWRWIIRNGPEEIDLNLELYPPNQIIVKKMHWHFGLLRFMVSKNGLQLSMRQSDDSDNYYNLLLLQDSKVRALQLEHSFVSITYKYNIYHSIKKIGINYQLLMNSMRVDSGENGDISFDWNEPIIIQ